MPAPVRRDGSRAKILHVEDNRENRMLVRAVLEAEGYTVIDAEDGLAGIEAAIREQPALILLDVNLPGVDGYEVVAIIKSFPAFATTPVIAVTECMPSRKAKADTGSIGKTNGSISASVAAPPSPGRIPTANPMATPTSMMPTP